MEAARGRRAGLLWACSGTETQQDSPSAWRWTEGDGEVIRVWRLGTGDDITDSNGEGGREPEQVAVGQAVVPFEGERTEVWESPAGAGGGQVPKALAGGGRVPGQEQEKEEGMVRDSRGLRGGGCGQGAEREEFTLKYRPLL